MRIRLPRPSGATLVDVGLSGAALAVLELALETVVPCENTLCLESSWNPLWGLYGLGH